MSVEYLEISLQVFELLYSQRLYNKRFDFRPNHIQLSVVKQREQLFLNGVIYHKEFYFVGISVLFL